MTAEPRYTFDAYYPDGSPRRYVGQWRPPRDDAERIAGYRTALGCYIPTYRVAEFEAWYATGRFDRALYAGDEAEVAAHERAPLDMTANLRGA